jgi:hypothetical protein
MAAGGPSVDLECTYAVHPLPFLLGDMKETGQKNADVIVPVFDVLAFQMVGRTPPRRQKLGPSDWPRGWSPLHGLLPVGVEAPAGLVSFAATTAKLLAAGPSRYRSPRHRMPDKLLKRGFNLRWIMWRVISTRPHPQAHPQTSAHVAVHRLTTAETRQCLTLAHSAPMLHIRMIALLLLHNNCREGDAAGTTAGREAIMRHGGVEALADILR